MNIICEYCRKTLKKEKAIEVERLITVSEGSFWNPKDKVIVVKKYYCEKHKWQI